MPATNHSRGFTLIELLLVVVILGVLAAMGLPLFAAVRTDAKRVATETTVHEVQRAIDLYKLQTGELPNLKTGWLPLMERKTVAGKTYGPWLIGTPTNFMTSADPSSVIEGTGEIFVDEAAFVYDYADGQGTGRLDASVRSRQ